jgi:hypothetical protein
LYKITIRPLLILIRIKGKQILNKQIEHTDGIGTIKINAVSGIYTAKITNINTKNHVFKKVLIKQD